MKRKVIKVLSAITLLVVWATVSAIFWGWIFTLLTDTKAAHKITIYADATMSDATETAAALEEGQPDGIRMVKLRPFTYELFGDEGLKSADLFIVPERDLETYAAWFGDLPEGLTGENGLQAVLFHDEENGITHLAGLITYEPGVKYYLVFGAQSLHISGRDGAVDNAACDTALRLLSME